MFDDSEADNSEDEKNESGDIDSNLSAQQAKEAEITRKQVCFSITRLEEVCLNL